MFINTIALRKDAANILYVLGNCD